MVKKLIELIILFLLILTALVVVHKLYDKEKQTVQLRCENGKCYVFMTTQAKGSWYELVGKTNVNELEGTLPKK
jgi:hypothetical protein